MGQAAPFPNLKIHKAFPPNEVLNSKEESFNFSFSLYEEGDGQDMEEEEETKDGM